MIVPTKRRSRTGASGCRRWNLLPLPGLLAAALLWLFAAGLPARAGEASSSDFTGILELFTSQGCASCPPADAILLDYARTPGIIALSYHVDYWDYIGWRDMLGSRQNTERQKAYGKAFHTRSIYTPQMIVNGSAQLAGTRRKEIDKALNSSAFRGKGKIRLVQDGDVLRVHATSLPRRRGGKPDPVLTLVTFQREATTNVSRGENAGRSLHNAHSVLDWRVLGAPDGDDLDVELPISMLADAPDGERGCVAFLQKVRADGTPGPIIAAAMLMIEE